MTQAISPYRELAVKQEENNFEKIIFVYGKHKRICPVCGKDTTHLLTYESNKTKLCTPFNRIKLTHHWFKRNIICNLDSAHYHCWCLDKDCKTHWIVIVRSELDIKLI